eukprot:5488211-Amphidinium_carterae.5
MESSKKLQQKQQQQHAYQGNAFKLNVKDFLVQGRQRSIQAWVDEVMLFLSIEEPRLTAIFRQTIRQPITEANVISGYNLEAESERFTSLSKVFLPRRL